MTTLHQTPLTTGECLEGARHLIEAVMDFDATDNSRALDHITQTLALVAPVEKQVVALVTALVNTMKALDIRFSDPVLEVWASWPARAPWIAAEISHAIQLNHSDSSEKVSAELQHYRERFQADPDGWPSQKILNMTGDREEARENIAFQRLALYEASEFESLKSLATTYPECQFRALAHLDIPHAAELAGHLHIGIYPHGNGRPENFLQQHELTSDMWRHRSSSYADFSGSELLQVLREPNAFLSAIYYDDTLLQYGVTLCGMDSFLPQTRAKLSMFNEMQLPTRLDIYAWQYFSCGNPELFHQLRSHHVDWYKLYQEVVSDLIISQSKECLLGIVDLNNPATKSHGRAGYVPVPSRLLFPTDHGGQGQIIRFSPYLLDAIL